MQLARGIAASLALFAVGCGGAPATQAASVPPVPTVAPRAATAAAAPPPAPEPDPERLAPRPALTPAEQTEFKTKCGAFSKAVEKSATGRTGAPVFRAAEAFKEVAANPLPGMKDDIRARCGELFQRDLEGYLVATLRVGAVGNLAVLAHLLDQALARGGTLCPSAPPVPRRFAVLADGVYTPTEKDYADPGWRCLENVSIVDHLLAQIRVMTDVANGTVTVSARTMPLRDGKMLEYVRVGKIEGLNIVWGEATTR